jgi:hypothetical protein
VSFATITLCVASQQVIPKINEHFFINSVWKLLDTPSYHRKEIILSHTYLLHLKFQALLTLLGMSSYGSSALFLKVGLHCDTEHLFSL